MATLKCPFLFKVSKVSPPAFIGLGARNPQRLFRAGVPLTSSQQPHGNERAVALTKPPGPARRCS
eukprot:scaffold179027_cov30-Tisochrysis_lutea.AAC.1